ncbi:MAG: hypothetical protein QOF60_136, partial [Actinomycetota bacterium]|nr:hypothetical protein [Actinomycetota bacterium]
MTRAGRRPALHLPEPRGPLSAHLLERLRWRPHRLPSPPAIHVDDPLTDDDLHLALYCCYELHYRGLAGVDPEWEWEPSLLEFRSRLETCFLDAVLVDVGPPVAHAGADVEAELHRILQSGTGPSLSGYMAERGPVEEFREFAVHRSAYQLKEADPHTWAIPRLDGEAKAALVLIQSDE